MNPPFSALVSSAYSKELEFLFFSLLSVFELRSPCYLGAWALIFELFASLSWWFSKFRVAKTKDRSGTRAHEFPKKIKNVAKHNHLRDQSALLSWE